MEHFEEIRLKGFPITRVYYLCKKCRRVFYDKKSAEEHLSSKCRSALNRKPSDVTAENKSNRLTYGQKLSKFQSLQSDEASQEGSNSYVCPVCKESFPLHQQLKKHLQIHARRFLCKACGKTFASAWWMKQHSLSYCKNRLVMCRRCGRVFVGTDALGKHCKVHFRDVYYICGLCGENHEKKFCYKNNKSRNVLELPLTVNPRANGILQKETYHQEQLSYAKLASSNELIAFTKPQFFPTDDNPSTFQEVALLVKIPLYITANSCDASEGVSTEGASCSSETANPGAFLDDSSTVEPSTSSANASPWNAWDRASLDPSVSSDTALQTIYLEGASSEILPSSFETAARLRISQEGGEALERESSQNTGAEFGNLLGCETLEIPSTITEIDNAIACFERQLLDRPSTEVVNPSSILEGSMLETPALSESESHVVFLEETLIGKNPSCEIANSCVIHEKARYDNHTQITSFADPITTEETSLKKSILINESTSSGSLLYPAAESKLFFISETYNPSYFSENAVPQNRMNLDLPASMHHLGTQLEDCSLYNILGDIDMDKVSDPTQEDSTDTVTNEVDNVSLRCDQATLITDNEKYETEMCNRTESHLYENSNILDVSDEDPEDYYLDSVESLKFLYG